MIILGIETSCDETALALIEALPAGRQGREEAGSLQCRVIQSLVHSQADLHSAYGGVFPTLAKREHGKNIVPLLHKLLIKAGEVLRADAEQERSQRRRDADRQEHSHSERAPRAHIPGDHSVGNVPHGNVPASQLTNLQFKETVESFRADMVETNPELFESFARADFLKDIPPIDRIAVTEGPGLEPALWVGINFARMLAALWQVPIIPVDHMEGHILGSLLPSDATNGVWQRLYDAPLPAIALLISGGHTELVKIARLGEYQILGRTLDDAVGEAFDKTARLLGLPYPGGPHIAELSHQAWQEKLSSPVNLPRPMIASGDLNFSFAGLKTAVLYAVRDSDKNPDGTLPDAFKKGLAHEFEQAAADTLDSKLRAGIELIGARSIIVGGGVAANHVLRQRFEKTAAEYGIPLFLPSRHISGDNALMIAIAGALHHAHAKTPGSLRAHGTKRLGN